MKDRFILLTGCSGGGKSTLLEALAARGFATVPEPGRRIVAEEMAGDGRALPWVDMTAFAGRAVAMARQDLDAARHLEGPVFFDRGLIDAAVALEHAGGPPLRETLGAAQVYAQEVLVVPPWPEIFAGDGERKHGFDAAEQEHWRIVEALGALGQTVREVPRVSVAERVAFVLATCGAG
ncbi:AAA family ATPase [Sagittula stellata]|uniref:ATPase-like protein n=1 Tax=Sagittula stellata (strain ATCC 700073 / DSM 11524 / E-37) TaxID=388399 RepID=A3K6D9_SAGS3|nr:AAA family ATPase [Sagittula stellata]EBA07289.1 ATPase-like protein [Sagittula stellata E-37]